MFYTTDSYTAHGLPHNPLKALIAPRPIAWVSTLDKDGNPNLAPFSFFNAMSDDPPVVVFSCSGGKPTGERKDTLANIQATGEFVAHIVPYELRHEMNATSAPLPAGTDEFEAAGLKKAKSKLVSPPRIAACPVALECKFLQYVPLPSNLTDGPYGACFGQVVGIHIDDDVIVDGMVNVLKYKPIARLGYKDYAAVTDVFSITRPEGGD